MKVYFDVPVNRLPYKGGGLRELVLRVQRNGGANPQDSRRLPSPRPQCKRERSIHEGLQLLQGSRVLPARGSGSPEDHGALGKGNRLIQPGRSPESARFRAARDTIRGHHPPGLHVPPGPVRRTQAHHHRHDRLQRYPVGAFQQKTKEVGSCLSYFPKSGYSTIRRSSGRQIS